MNTLSFAGSAKSPARELSVNANAVEGVVCSPADAAMELATADGVLEDTIGAEDPTGRVGMLAGMLPSPAGAEYAADSTVRR